MTDKPPLDDLMLAMDVVDTLRHNEKLVAQELDGEAREDTLLKRLKSIYAAQGMQVPDHILQEGVAALREQRFVYTPTPPSFGRGLAHLYVSRNLWGLPLLAILLVAVLAWGGYRYFVVAPREQAVAAQQLELNETLPKAFAEWRQVVLDTAKDAAGAEAAEAAFTNGMTALRGQDLESARKALQQLQGLQQTLLESYAVRIVTGPGEQSGIWRIPDVNSNARNYYLIVEAVAEDGTVKNVTVTSEESGAVKTVTKWGERVDEPVFFAVRDDKQDDGIIQKRAVGVKSVGHLGIDYSLDVLGGKIFEW